MVLHWCQKMVIMTHALKTDASGTWGCGAPWGKHWFQWKWEGPSQEWLIAQKELLPILFAMEVWGREWQGQRGECHCDNAAVVAVVSTGRSKDKVLMHLLRYMFFVAAWLHLHLHAVHVPGLTNVAADSLSRKNFANFLQVMPQGSREPTLIPKELVNLSVMDQPDWTSHLYPSCSAPAASRFTCSTLHSGDLCSRKEKVSEIQPGVWYISHPSNWAKTVELCSIHVPTRAKIPDNEVLPFGSSTSPGNTRGLWSKGREYAFVGACTVQNKKGAVRHPKVNPPPYNTWNLEEMLQVWNLEPASWNHRMLWVACCVGFYASCDLGNLQLQKRGIWH